MQPYFIVGYPRSRTAWLANLMTAGDSFCYHEAIRQCGKVEDLHKLFEQVGKPFVGDSDPTLPLYAKQVMEMFPSARWVFIQRDKASAKKALSQALDNESVKQALGGEPQVSKAFEMLEKGIATLRDLADESLIVPYEALDEAAALRMIWGHCLGDVPFDEKRAKMLGEMKVTAIPEKVIAAGVKLPPVSSIQTPCHKEYLELLSQMCGQNRAAYKWLEDVMEVCLTLDHIVDDDELDVEMAERCITALMFDWPINPFWQANKALLLPVMMNVLESWKHPGERIKEFDAYTEIPCAVAICLGGRSLLGQFSGRIRPMVKKIMADDERIDLWEQ